MTCDLFNEAIGPRAVGFILELSEPDVELVRLVPAMIVVELETLHLTFPRGRCPCGL